MNTQILKEYSLKQIQDLSKNYKHCMIEDVNSKKITVWNPTKVPIADHLKECIKRLNSEIVPEGYYYFCFSHATRFNKDSADRYLYCKGTAPTQTQAQPNPFNNGLKDNKNDLISVQSALGYITEIANLKVTNQFLEAENKRLKDENAVLEAELAEMDREEGLNEGKPNGTLEYLKETAPTLMALADRYFTHQDRVLLLQEKKVELQSQEKPRLKIQIKKFEPGTAEHINFIKLLYAENKENEFNQEMDKIEILNPVLYNELCTELNINENENGN